MKRFSLWMAVCFLVLPGMIYAAETETRTWTDANGVKHIVTITRETQQAEDSGQSTTAEHGSQEQIIKKQAVPEKTAPRKQENRKTEQSLPAGVNPNGSFQFDIDSHKPKF